jgi:hypothetical protein
MNSNNILGIITVLIPDIMRFVKDYQTRNGSLPTDEEIIDKLNLDAARVLEIGNKWLREHPNV